MANGNLVGSATTSPYTLDWTAPPAGTHLITAVATDSAGGVTTSAARTITIVANQPPVVSLASPSAGQAFTAPIDVPLAVSVSDPDTPIVQVEYRANGTPIGSAIAPPWTATWANAPAGTHAITAIATDALGATATSAPVSITVVANPPQAKIYYLHTDHLDTPRLVTDAAATAVWRHLPTNEPFGDGGVEEDPGHTGQAFEMPLAFPGQVRDKETGLSYNFFRDYDPATGRYVQSDPIRLGGGVNTYGYVGGAPVSKADPFGLLEHFMMELNGQAMSNLECACRQDSPAFSGNPPYRNDPDATNKGSIGPAPEGLYYIVDRPKGGIGGQMMSFFTGRDKWFALYRNDGTPGDDTVEGEQSAEKFDFIQRGHWARVSAA